MGAGPAHQHKSELISAWSPRSSTSSSRHLHNDVEDQLIISQPKRRSDVIRSPPTRADTTEKKNKKVFSSLSGPKKGGKPVSDLRVRSNNNQEYIGKRYSEADKKKVAFKTTSTTGLDDIVQETIYEPVTESKTRFKRSVKPEVVQTHKQSGTTRPFPTIRHPQRLPTTPVELLSSSTQLTIKAEVHHPGTSRQHIDINSHRQENKRLVYSQYPIQRQYDDGADAPLHYSEIGRPRQQFANNVFNNIDPRIRYDLSRSVPVYSGEVRPNPKKREELPTVHWAHNFDPFEPDRFRDPPPCPAPSTPVTERARSPRFPGEHLHSQEPRRTEYSSEDIKYFKHTPGPRLVVINQPNDSVTEIYYVNGPTVAPYTCKQSLIGAASPDDPIHSYLGPKNTPPTLSSNSYKQPKSFGEKIFAQYHSRDPNNAHLRRSTAMMNPLEDSERKIIIEFCHLLEKSKQLFNGLRELPQYGHKQWSSYFGRTFDTYSKIWKFQQTHRAILDSRYGMKRWQIGEIASKIGQLYYHFYLRTSETAYLNEAFSFYSAIRGRCYYTKANREDKCELMVKKLRYYARFIVVCLLLNKMKLVKELIKELERQIIEYGNTYDPDDQVEWTVVVEEIKAFIHAEPVVSIVNSDNQTMILSHRLSPLMTPPVERTSQMNLSLQEIVIVGSNSQQVKFSELTMDMFRMLQTLEREPSGDIQHIFDESPRQRFMSTPNAQSQEGVDAGQKLANSHKYLLFKPPPSQMLVYLSCASNDLPPNGVLLLYISADGHVPQNGKLSEDGTWGYDQGGLITTTKNEVYRDCSKDPKSAALSKYKELQCFYPGDMYPYTRRPLFVIVESDNSYAFQNVPRHFGQPLVVLMSPLDMPPSFHDSRRYGSLFTLFLHSPLEGLCYCCDLSSVPLALWDRAQMLMDNFMAEASSLLIRGRIDPTYISYMGDDFLRTLLVRYVFCEGVLRQHRLFRGRTHRTRCSPPLPDELFENPTLVQIILDITNVLQIRSNMQEPPGVNNAGSGPPN